MVPELILNNVRIPSLKWPELSIWRRFQISYYRTTSHMKTLRFRTAISSRLRLTTLLNSKLYKIWIILICLADIGKSGYLKILTLPWMFFSQELCCTTFSDPLTSQQCFSTRFSTFSWGYSASTAS